MRIVVIALLAAILLSLGSAAVLLFRRDQSSSRMAKALTIRIGLSILLFLILMGSFRLGLIGNQHL